MTVKLQRQDQFLLDAGILDQLESLTANAANDTEVAALRLGARRLMMPDRMGASFKFSYRKSEEFAHPSDRSHKFMSATMIIVPGVNNSGPEHWQSIWQLKYPRALRVEQDDWDLPERDAWVAGLSRAVNSADGELVLVAHSLGCLTVAHWALGAERPIKGALLVAPVDLETPDYPPGVGCFTPTPMNKLSFPSTVVGSSDDGYCSLARSEEFARAWGSRFVNAGPSGHINAAAGRGEWPEGEELLRELLQHGEKT
ncbi:MAG: alpha/beta hydrolase [Pyrinomonadaceae bacterium]